MSHLASPGFVCSERIQDLESLVASARRARETRETHVVILTGPSGIGKTRLIQELFGRLTCEYDHHGFWVPTIEDREAARPDNRIVPGRNDVVPSKRCGFAWVPVKCSPAPDGFGGPDSGSIVDAARVVRLLHVDKRLDRLRTRALIVLLVAVAAQGIFSVLGVTGLGWVSPLLGLVGLTAVVWDSAEAIRGVRDARRLRKRQREAEGELGSEDPCETIQRVTKKMPLTVVVVDDAQFADEATLEVLGKLLRAQQGQLFVVAKWSTVEPEALQGATFEDWLIELGMTPLKMAIGPIDDLSMSQLVKRLAPTAHPDEADFVASFSGGNPGTALFVLGLEKIQRLLKDQSRALDSLDLELKSLPPSNDDLIRVEWSYFPSQVRRLLAIAAQVGRTVPTSRLKGVFAKYLTESVDPLIGTARSPYRWLEEIDALADRFSQENLYRFALSQASQELLIKELEVLHQEILVVLSDVEISSQASAALAGSVAHLGASNLRTHAAAASRESVAATLMAIRVLSRPSQARTRLEYCDRVLDWVNAYPEAGHQNHSTLVMALYFKSKSLEILDPKAAIDCRLNLEKIITADDALYGDFRLQVAKDAQKRGDHVKALAIFEELSERPVYPVSQGVKIAAIANRALSASAADNVRLALSLSRRANKFQKQESGRGSQPWLVGNTNIANYLFRLGRQRRAQRLLVNSLSVAKNKLGQNHPACVRAEAILLWFDSRKLSAEMRVEKYSEYIARAEPALGRFERAVTEAKRDLAGALIDVGELDAARDLAVTLEEDCCVAFGESSRARRECQMLLKEIEAKLGPI